MEGYQGVNCPFCRGLGKGPWQSPIKRERIVAFLKWYGEKSAQPWLKSIGKQSLLLAPDRESSLKLRLYVGEKVAIVPKAMLRRYFGRFDVPSNNFVAYQINGQFTLIGDGLGHGVGMCQLGALQLAKRGYDYRQILSYYFPKHRLERVY